MNLDLRRLGHVLSVARTRSFSRAAKQLSITQPALSRSIASLEADLEVRLFDRGRGGVVVTPAGKALIKEAEQLVSRARTLEQNAALWRNGQTESVSFGIGPLPASIFLPRLLGQITRTHARLVANVSVCGVDDLIAGLESDKIEFGICAETAVPALKRLSIEVIGEIPLGLFVRAGHPLLGAKQINRSDLERFSIASGSLPSWQSLDDWMSKSCTPSIFCDNYHILKDVMLSSDAILLASSTLLITELQDGRAVALDVDLPEVSQGITFCAVRLANRTRSQTADLVLKSIAELVGTHSQDTTRRRVNPERRARRSQKALAP